MKLIILTGIFFIILVSLAFITIVITASHKIIYNKPQNRSPFENLAIATETLKLEEITLTNSQGQTLYAWFKRNPAPLLSSHILLLQHGYKSNRSEMLHQAQMFYEAGFSIILTSIRSHDLSQGELITFALNEAEDIHLWHTYLTETQKFDPQKIGFIGNSMGGAAVLHAHAKYGDGAVIVIQSVFAKMEQTIEMGVSYFTPFPGSLFGASIAKFIHYKTGINSSQIQPVKWAEEVSIPIFIMQGGEDKAAPPASGQQLFNAVKTHPSKKELWFEPAQGHVGFELKFPEDFESRVIPFLVKNLVKSSPPSSD